MTQIGLAVCSTRMSSAGTEDRPRLACSTPTHTAKAAFHTRPGQPTPSTGDVMCAPAHMPNPVSGMDHTSAVSQATS